MLGGILSLLFAIISVFRKKGHSKYLFIISGAFFSVLLITVVTFPVQESNKEDLVNVEKEESIEKSTQEVVEVDKRSQEEINEHLKMVAEKANFVELNVDDPPNGKKVFIDGEITVLYENGTFGEFMLASKEGEGYGAYNIILLNTTDIKYWEGDQVRVYGAVNGKDESGMPQVLATILEKNKED